MIFFFHKYVIVLLTHKVFLFLHRIFFWLLFLPVCCSMDILFLCPVCKTLSSSIYRHISCRLHGSRMGSYLFLALATWTCDIYRCSMTCLAVLDCHRILLQSFQAFHQMYPLFIKLLSMFFTQVKLVFLVSPKYVRAVAYIATSSNYLCNEFSQY